LLVNLLHYGIATDDIPNAFNIFMNVHSQMDGKLTVNAPNNKAGDYLVLEALMNLIVGITACSAEDSNGGTFKPIVYEVYD